MPDPSSDLRPIQVFLDTKRFLETPEPKPFVPGTKDFFKDNNRGFIEHKKRLKDRVEGIATSLRREKQPGGFIKVRQREEALAKSHRPVGALFTQSNHFALVGAEHVGELLFQVTPQALDSLAGIIGTKAEETPRKAINKKTGEEEERVSGYRSELGGVEDIRLYGATDRISFSAEQAVQWMHQPNVIGGYIVELFRPERAVSPTEVDAMIALFRTGLNKLTGGLLVRPILPSTASSQFGQPTLALSISLTKDDRRLIEFPFEDDGSSPWMVESALPPTMRNVEGDLTVARHAELLAFLAEQSLVRSVELPPVLETTPTNPGTSLGKVALQPPRPGADYPTLGIIDGGVSEATLAPWKVGDAGLVPPSDRDESHGTFIAGLVSAGSLLNPPLSPMIEATGCKFYDIDLFPRRELRSRYYADIEELFDVLDEKVKVAKRDHGVRIFNLSFSIGSRSSRLAYSLAADRLDRIAHANDVLFVVAAGNLPPASRPSWPEKAEDAAIMLASFAGDNQHLTAPAEHVLGITVGAVNPHGIAGHVPELPTTYTRRAPGSVVPVSLTCHTLAVSILLPKPG
ncbi:S8 family serine peptidase [Oscillatoria amoena NRMC-F 0135]|nr:S8 family serine peptidase [Oscillatoria amoena NRMC-F 0135]